MTSSQRINIRLYCAWPRASRFSLPRRPGLRLLALRLMPGRISGWRVNGDFTVRAALVAVAKRNHCGLPLRQT